MPILRKKSPFPVHSPADEMLAYNEGRIKLWELGRLRYESDPR